MVLTTDLSSIQGPNRPHYVNTLENSVAEGNHYYSAACVQDTVHQIVHTFVRRFLVTNAEHPSARMLLRRMLTTSVDWYLKGDWESGE
jgi:hypothetical protein